MPDLKSKGPHIIVLSTAALLLCYTCYRAKVLGFTMDESTTFIYYTLDTYHNIINYVNLDANNHVLNSIITRFISGLLPLSEFTLRIQSLAAHLVFMLFTWLLLKDIKNPASRIASFLILNTSPYLLDFFSLARGYAMGWAFLSASLYFLKSFMEKDNRKVLHAGLAFVFAAIATMANFAIFHYYCALLVIFTVYGTWRTFIRPIPGKNKTWFLVAVLVVGGISYPTVTYTISILVKLRQNSMFVFGGDTGFFADTLHSVAENLLYKTSYADVGTPVLMIVYLILFALALSFAGWKMMVKKENTSQSVFFISLLAILLMVISATVLQHYFLGIKFLMDRAAIYLYIIFLLIIVYLGNYFSESYKTGRFFLPGLAALSLIHFGFAANVTHTNNWVKYADNKTIMQDIGLMHDQKQLMPEGKAKIMFMPYWYNYTTARFYQYLYHYSPWLDVDETNKIDFTEDIIYRPEADKRDIKYPFSNVKTYLLSGASLAKNRKPRRIELLESKHFEFADTVLKHVDMQKFFKAHTNTSPKYIELLPGVFSPVLLFDANKYKSYSSLRIKVGTSINFIDDAKPGVLGIAVYDSANKILDWHDMKFDPTLYISENGWSYIPFSVDLNKLDSHATIIKIFIWNNGKETIWPAYINAEVLHLEEMP